MTLDLDELARLEAEATAGPWSLERPWEQNPELDSDTGPGEIWPPRPECLGRSSVCWPEAERDAELICAIRNAAPELIAAVRERDEFRALLKESRGYVAAHVDEFSDEEDEDLLARIAIALEKDDPE